MIQSKIFQKAVAAGAQILQDGSVYVCRQSKHVPNRWIQQTVAPNGNYAYQISENGAITKVINNFKLGGNGKSIVTDTWDFTKNKGVRLDKACASNDYGEYALVRSLEKVTSNDSVNPDGLIYRLSKGMAQKLNANIKYMANNVSVPKMTSPNQWLNEQFYKIYNK